MERPWIHKRAIFRCISGRALGLGRGADHVSLRNQPKPELPITAKQVDEYIASLEREFSRDRHNSKVLVREDPKRPNENSTSIVPTLVVWIAILMACSIVLFRIVEEAFR